MTCERSLGIGQGVWTELGSAWGNQDYTAREQNKQNRASNVEGLSSSFHTGVYCRKRCWLENSLLLSCTVTLTSVRRTSSGLMSKREGHMISIHDFERVYGLGSQTYIYEGKSSSSSNYSTNSQESLCSQQMANLTTELKHI
ncbi:hypothetical protein M5K25_002485 [Dendrobium thyrsiflorum]|uniref:Uncharacterized protein n=1 Tax=Dendrobium thyrsiflorum TaxID=117978 RepID=A0ABD0VMI1_DENTH